MKIIKTHYGLRIYLDETDQKTFSATSPLSEWFLAMMVKACSKLLLTFISHGKEEIEPYLNRIQTGESAEEVAIDMCQKFGTSVPIISLGISEDEIYQALGWSKEECLADRKEVSYGIISIL